MTAATSSPGAGDAHAYWCELAWLGNGTAEPGVLLGTRGDRIEEVARAETPPPGATRLDGLTLPGLANAHSHAFQRALRGRTQSDRGSFWTWREQMYALAAALEPGAYRRLARATFAEMALAGVSLVGEFHYLHHDRDGSPYANPNELGEAILGAAAEAGVRLTLLDTCYLQGGIGEPLSPAQQRFADPSAEAWCERADALRPSDTARIGGAIHSIRAVDPESARQVAGWAAANEAPLHAHVSEQPAENEDCLRAYQATPTAVLAEQGAVTPRFTAVHATHLTREDVALLGENGACCCVCPTTERDLADGIGDARSLRDAGASVALGSDSHAVIDLFEEARAVELDERLATGERGRHTATELLDAATAAGYASLGWPDGGRIAPGMLADFTTVSLDSVRLAGTSPAAAPASVVFAACAADVRHVFVGGRQIVTEGRHVDLDVPAELQAAIGEILP